MKLNDIYINKERDLTLKKDKRILLVEKKIKKRRSIDCLNKNLGKINLGKVKLLQISDKSEKNIDSLGNKRDKINLEKIIRKKNKLSYYIDNLFLFFTNKTKIISPKNRYLKVLSYIFFIFSFILLDKIIIESLIISWINNLYKVPISSNIENIETQLSKAKTKFNIANILFLPFKLIPEQNLININKGIYILRETSQLSLDWVDFYRKTNNFIKNREINDIYFTNLLENSKPFFIKSEKKINNIYLEISNINLKYNKNSNSNYQKLEKIKESLKIIKGSINIISNNFSTFLEILWKNKAKNYFIVFQNNDEIRPTGGFIWSAWILEIFEWRIKTFKKRDIYAYEWDVKKNYTEKVIAPSWVNLLSERLWLRDSNAFIDFSSSAKSINYFMKKWWYNIDWVIFINQRIILDILKNIWIIDFWKYDTKITSENFSEIISLLIEAKVSKKSTLDTPKQVLFDLGKLLINKIKEEKKYLNILKIFINNIKSRDLVIYNFNKKENELLSSLKLTWAFDYKNITDFNYPFFISIWWNKSDKYIKRKYYKYIKVEKNTSNNLCNLNTYLKIELKNTFKKADEKRILLNMKKFRIKPNTDLINIAWKWLNQNFTKIIIPKNAILNQNLLNNSWYKVIDHKIYKTVEKLIKTNPWEKSFFELSYTLNNINCKIHSIKLYKQAWIYKYDIDFKYNNTYINNKKIIKVSWLKEDFYYNLD